MICQHAKLTLLAIAIAAPLTAPLTAQRIENLSQSEAVKKAYAPIIESANRSVVEILVDGEARILGTAVAQDLVVSKYSELTRKSPGENSSAKLQCRKAKQTWEANLIGFDRPADLALLRVPSAKLEAIEWQIKMPTPGAFLASPDGSELPIGIGIMGTPLYQYTEAIAFLGIRFANGNSGPAKLAEVVAHGPANAAGLLANDVVIKFQGEEITDSPALRNMIRSCKPGDSVRVTVLRDDKEQQFTVKLGTNNSAQESGQEEVWGELSEVRSGFQQVLQHDAILLPSEIGGPVVDLTGMTLGINIARAGRVETLALPASVVQKLVKTILSASKPAKQKATK